MRGWWLIGRRRARISALDPMPPAEVNLPAQAILLPDEPIDDGFDQRRAGLEAQQEDLRRKLDTMKSRLDLVDLFTGEPRS